MATFAVTGIRLGEAVALSVASLDGPPGERRLTVVGKGDQARALPLYPALEAVLEAYLASRAARFPDHDLAGPPLPLFVHGGANVLEVQQLLGHTSPDTHPALPRGDRQRASRRRTPTRAIWRSAGLASGLTS